MACAIHQRVDASPALKGLIHKPLQVVIRLVRTGDTDATEFVGQRLAFPR